MGPGTFASTVTAMRVQCCDAVVHHQCLGAGRDGVSEAVAVAPLVLK